LKEDKQQRVFTNWVNFKLDQRTDVAVSDLMTDLRDGFVLYALLEELSGESLRPLGRMNRKAKMRIQLVANMNIVFKYLKSCVKVVNIGPQDIVDSTNETLVLGLIWSIIVFFMAKELQGDGGDGSGGGGGGGGGGVGGIKLLKQCLLDWVFKLTTNDGSGEPPVKNMQRDFADGKAFLRILHRVDPDASPYDPSDDALENIRAAFSDAEAKYGIPCLIDDEDPEFWKDEKAMIPQLAEWMDKLPHVDLLDAEASAAAAMAEAEAAAAAAEHAEEVRS